MKEHWRHASGTKRNAGFIEIGRRGLGRISCIQRDSSSLKAIRTQERTVDVIGIESAIPEDSIILQRGMCFSEVIQNGL
jgi:hypothetical protein